MNINNKGLIIISILFITLASFIGLSILSGTIFHIKILGAKKQKNILINGLMSGTIKYLHDFRGKIYVANLNDFEFPETEYFNREEFKDINNQIIIKNNFNNRVFEIEGYKSIDVKDTIFSSYSNKNIAIETEVDINILSGYIPVSSMPLYINKDDIASKDLFLKEKNISINSSEFFTKNDTGVKLLFDEFIRDTLDLNDKYINWAEIRERADEPILDLPLERGLYTFFKNEERDILTAVFVQGDIQKLIFSIFDSKQRIIIIQDNIEYIIEYIPQEYSLKYWGQDFEENKKFLERIIVNGNIFSMMTDGDFAFTKATDLTVYSSGIINIDSSLNSDTYSRSNLRIITGNSEFFDKQADGGKVVINRNINEDSIKLSINFIVEKSVDNKSDDLSIIGSVYTENITNSGHIKVLSSFLRSPVNRYFTGDKFTFIKSFNISFNGEVYND